MAYLDENGLEHFWGKIKDHVSSAVAPKANDADVVHKTGDETIQGVKTFQNTAEGHTAGTAVTDLVIRNPEVARGTVGTGRSFTRVIFADAEGNTEETFAGRLGILEVVSPKENDINGEALRLDCYRYSNNSVDYSECAGFRVGYDKNGIPFSTAPATSDDRTDSTDIVTRGYMEASEWNWQKTKKAGAVTFKPVPESDLELVVDLMFTETLPAEGEKGPENPSTITGVNKINLYRANKNILAVADFRATATIKNVTWTNNGDGSISVTRNSAGDGTSFYDIKGLYNALEYFPAGTYTFTRGGEASNVRFGLSTADTAVVTILGSDVTKTFTLEEGMYLHFYAYLYQNDAASNVVIRPQLEFAPEASSYEIGISNTYQVSFGDTYYGGSLDVATGVMTVNYKGLVFDGTESQWISADRVGTSDVYRYTISLSDTAAVNDDFDRCSHFDYEYSWYNTSPHFYVAPGFVGFFSTETTLDAFKSFLATQYANGTPVTVVYELATPQTVQLTPTQIRSLPALDKYEPRINTVYTDQEAVQVGYQRFANYVDLTTNQTIDGEKVFRKYIRVKDKSFSASYCVFPYDTYSSRADVLDSVAVFNNNNDKRLSLIRTIDKDSNGNRITNIYTIPASGGIPGSSALTIGLLDVDGAAIGYAQAESTPEYEADGVTKRTSGKDIVTRNWIPKDTRIVHTTGNETIGGRKYFSDVTVFGSTNNVYEHLYIGSVTNSVRIAAENFGASTRGAGLQLSGRSAPTDAGQFLIFATNATSDKHLIGKPDGTLTWDGQSIQTSSDERVKTPLSEVPDAVLDAWEDVNWGQFQYLEAVEAKGESARLHLGLIAQHVMSVFGKHGLDACAYGILCHEERPAVDEEETVVDAEAYTDEEGVEHPAVTHVETRHEDAVDLWMVRYAEAQAMEACCVRRENARLKKRIADLEERLAALELKIS